MFSFANPEYLYLLLLLPIVAGLFWLSQRAKAKKIAKFGRAGVVKELMPEQSKYKPWIRLTVELVLLATIVVILARPRGGAQETNTTMKGIEVMICLDVSNSMNAASDDDAPDVSRLQRSKQVLEKLIDRITGNKVGLIVFAGNAICRCLSLAMRRVRKCISPASTPTWFQPKAQPSVQPSIWRANAFRAILAHKKRLSSSPMARTLKTMP